MTDKNTHDFLTNCPVGGAIEILGDKWSLLILRDIALKGKRTHGELLRSKEKIATNILADRLERLEASGVIVREPHPTDGRVQLFHLTEKGLGIVPILLDIIEWSAQYDPHVKLSPGLSQLLKTDRSTVIQAVRKSIHNNKPVIAS